MLDFNGLNQTLNFRVRELLTEWCPGGRIVGREYEAATVRGGKGSSFKFNLDTHKFADFATGQRGGDLISLYACIQGLSPSQAHKKLSELYNGPRKADVPALPPPIPKKTHRDIPPADAPTASFTHHRFGNPSQVWTYEDTVGVLFHVARYEPPNEKKQYVPFTWSNSTDNKWVHRAWTHDRPLYNLKKIKENPDKPILLTEGEKSADAAQKIVGNVYIATTWSGGAQAFEKTDFSPIYGRKILLWPDADKPGRDVMHKIANMLHKHATEIKIIQSEDRLNYHGWDAADSCFTWNEFKEWAKPRTSVYHPVIEPEVMPVIQDEAPHPADIEEKSKEFLFDDIAMPDDHKALASKLKLVCNDKGNPVPNGSNVLKVFEYYDYFKDFVWVDEFHRKIFTKWNSEKPREWTESDDAKLCVILQRYFGFYTLSQKHVDMAVIIFAFKNKRNEPKDWLETLKWDKQPRIDDFFTNYCGVELGEYSSAISKNFWISMVARIYDPGCKMDNMVILEGKQGKFKSTALKAIGGDWYSEIHADLNDKDFLLATQGKLVIEIGELAGFNKHEASFLKKLISCQTDRFRVPYGKRVEDFPRQCVFVGTTNEDDYLTDSTGGRRFWPLKIGEISIDSIKKNRDQLFAEAVSRFKLGENWWEVPQKLAENEQEDRREVDLWETLIQDHLIGKSETTINEIADKALKIEARDLTPWTYKRIAKSLRVLGWRKRNRMINAIQRKAWVKFDD